MNARKLLTIISRVFVGVLFIISGLIKANDPTGFAYKLNEYWEVFHIPFLTPLSVYMAMFICVFEIYVGINLLLGYMVRLTMILYLLMIIFFSFLTFYSAYFHKVTDCGCFGDALKLTPWQSFTKDLVLLVFILILYFNQKFITPIFSDSNRKWLSVCGFMLPIFFTTYCYHYLPVKDFLPYAKGKDIVQQMTVPKGALTDSFVTTLIYTKDGKEFNFTMDQLMKVKDMESYKWKETKNVLVREGYKPPIHDFVIYDLSGRDLTKEFLAQTDYRLIIVQQDLEKSNASSQKNVNELVNGLMQKSKVKIWAFTSSSSSMSGDYTKAYNVPYTFFNADGTMLKSMIRSNPGVFLLKDNKILDKWPGTSCPTVEQVLNEMKEE